MKQKATTIPLNPRVRDRLKSYGSMGDTYNDIVMRMMDEIERKAFLAKLRKQVDDPATEWVSLEDLRWEKKGSTGPMWNPTSGR